MFAVPTDIPISLCSHTFPAVPSLSIALGSRVHPRVTADVPLGTASLCMFHPQGETPSIPDLLKMSPLFPRISAKDLKNMLSQVNYRVPNMRFLRERLTVSVRPLCPPPQH